MGASGCTHVLWLFIAWRPPPTFPLITSSALRQPHRGPVFRSDVSSSMPTARLYPDQGGEICGYFTIGRRDPFETFLPLGDKSFLYIGNPVSRQGPFGIILKKIYDILVHIAKKKISSIIGYHSLGGSKFILFIYIYFYASKMQVLTFIFW